jgi:hypothetical protein
VLEKLLGGDVRGVVAGVLFACLGRESSGRNSNGDEGDVPDLRNHVSKLVRCETVDAR